jgi:hypothetical protein
LLSREPNVSAVHQQGERVVVEFEDGHAVILEPYSPRGKGTVDGLKRFTLNHNGRRVVQFNARLSQDGKEPKEHTFVATSSGYTAHQVVSYWEAAKDHLYLHQRRSRLALLQYLTIAEDWLDLNKIKDGKIQMR